MAYNSQDFKKQSLASKHLFLVKYKQALILNKLASDISLFFILLSTMPH